MIVQGDYYAKEKNKFANGLCITNFQPSIYKYLNNLTYSLQGYFPGEKYAPVFDQFILSH